LLLLFYYSFKSHLVTAKISTSGRLLPPLSFRCWPRYIQSHGDCSNMAAPLTWLDQQNQPPLPIKLEIAYDILQPNKLSFDIAQIDRCINLIDRGGDGGLCITSSGSSLRHTNNILLTRLCVRALLSKRQGGFGSPSVIFVDAGNCSDIYQCVNFAR
jgi:hypothetical protein